MRRSDFALVLCPPWDYTKPPWWLAQLAAVLRGRGLRGRCHDVNFAVARSLREKDINPWEWELTNLHLWEKDAGYFESLLPKFNRVLDFAAKIVLEDSPQVVGFSVTQASVLSSLHFARLLKAGAPEDIRIVFGGPGAYWIVPGRSSPSIASMHDPWTGEWRDEGRVVDVFLRGECDETLPMLLRRLLSGEDPMMIPGTVVRSDGICTFGPPPVRPKNLDLLPDPDFSDFPVADYESRSMPLLMSRGCDQGCVFCNDCHLQGAFRTRSARAICNEMSEWNERYGIRRFVSNGLLLNGSLLVLRDLCRRIMDTGVSFTWSGQAALSSDMNAELLQSMRNAGCVELTFGLESLSEPVVASMGKGFTVRSAMQLMKRVKDSGIRVSVNFVVGFPTETRTMFDDTVEMVPRLRGIVDRVQAVNVCHLTTHARLWESPELFGIEMGPVEPWLRWQGPAGNTYEERLRRHTVLLEELSSNDIPIAEDNLYDKR